MNVDLPAFGIADQADVGEQFEREVQRELLAGLAGLHLARRAVGGGREVRVAQTAPSALGDAHSLAGVSEVGLLLGSPRLGVAHANERADRNGNVQVAARSGRGDSSPRHCRRAGRHIQD